MEHFLKNAIADPCGPEAYAALERAIANPMSSLPTLISIVFDGQGTENQRIMACTMLNRVLERWKARDEEGRALRDSLINTLMVRD